MRRYQVSVNNTVVVPNPGYVLVYGETADAVEAFLVSLGFLVTAAPVAIA